MRRFIDVAVVALAAALSGTARADILIGAAGPLTGSDAWTGHEMQRGTEMAVADINSAGGVLAQQVRLILADDFCDAEQGTAAARKLVGDGGSSSLGICAPVPLFLHLKSTRRRG